MRFESLRELRVRIQTADDVWRAKSWLHATAVLHNLLGQEPDDVFVYPQADPDPVACC